MDMPSIEELERGCEKELKKEDIEKFYEETGLNKLMEEMKVANNPN